MDKICPICNKRPIPGYVNGPGIYLERMCYQCYKKAGSQTVREGGGWQVGRKGGR